MSAISISIQMETHTVCPGAPVKGRVTVLAPVVTEVKSADIILFWRTEGKGTQDEGVAVTERLLDQGQQIGGQLEHEFALIAPELPWTYYGTLIKIHWWVGVYIDPARGAEASEESPILINPDPDYATRQAT